MIKLKTAVLTGLLPVLCSCSSTYVFNHPYGQVVNATLKHCEAYEKKVNKKAGPPAFRYSGRDLDRCFLIEITDVYGKEESTITIRRKSPQRTKVSIRTLDRSLPQASRVPEAEQEWLYRIARELRSEAPADKAPFEIKKED